MSLTIRCLVASSLLLLPSCKKSKEDSASQASAPAASEAGADKVAVGSEPAAQPEPTKPEAPAVAATTLETDDFTVPIPAGFEAMTKEKLADLSKQFGQEIAGVLIKPRASPDHFVSSFVFTLIASEKEDPMEGCAQLAEEMAKATGAKAETPKQVEFSFGKTCQLEMGDEKQRAIQTIVFVGKKWWTLTCNHDPSDEASPKECNEVLAGFAGR
jgi:hypothetical protein